METKNLSIDNNGLVITVDDFAFNATNVTKGVRTEDGKKVNFIDITLYNDFDIDDFASRFISTKPNINVKNSKNVNCTYEGYNCTDIYTIIDATLLRTVISFSKTV